MTHMRDAAYNMVRCSQESMHKANLPAGERFLLKEDCLAVQWLILLLISN